MEVKENPTKAGVEVREGGCLAGRRKSSIWALYKQSLSWVIFMHSFIHSFLNKHLKINHVLPAKPCARVVWGSSSDSPCLHRAYSVMGDAGKLPGDDSSRMSRVRAQDACLG